MKTTKRKKQETLAHNVEVYNHLNDEYIKSNELTIPEQIFAWVVASLMIIALIYAIL